MSRDQGLLRALAILALIVGAFFAFNSMQHEEPAPLLRLETPKASASPADTGLDFSAAGLDGKEIDLSHYRGHPVIVDFWATWCAPCRRQIPELVGLYKKYNKSRGLVIIGVSCDLIQGDGMQAVAPFVKELGINYPIALADQRLVDSMGVEAIPTTLFVGPDGRMVSRIVGAGRAGEIIANAKLLLEAAARVTGRPGVEDTGGHAVDISDVE